MKTSQVKRFGEFAEALIPLTQSFTEFGNDVLCFVPLNKLDVHDFFKVVADHIDFTERMPKRSNLWWITLYSSGIVVCNISHLKDHQPECVEPLFAKVIYIKSDRYMRSKFVTYRPTEFIPTVRFLPTNIIEEAGLVPVIRKFKSVRKTKYPCGEGLSSRWQSFDPCNIHLFCNYCYSPFHTTMSCVCHKVVLPQNSPTGTYWSSGKSRGWTVPMTHFMRALRFNCILKPSCPGFVSAREVFETHSSLIVKLYKTIMFSLWVHYNVVNKSEFHDFDMSELVSFVRQNWSFLLQQSSKLTFAIVTECIRRRRRSPHVHIPYWFGVKVLDARPYHGPVYRTEMDVGGSDIFVFAISQCIIFVLFQFVLKFYDHDWVCNQARRRFEVIVPHMVDMGFMDRYALGSYIRGRHPINDVANDLALVAATSLDTGSLLVALITDCYACYTSIVNYRRTGDGIPFILAGFNSLWRRLFRDKLFSTYMKLWFGDLSFVQFLEKQLGDCNLVRTFLMAADVMPDYRAEADFGDFMGSNMALLLANVLSLVSAAVLAKTFWDGQKELLGESCMSWGFLTKSAKAISTIGALTAVRSPDAFINLLTSSIELSLVIAKQMLNGDFKSCFSNAHHDELMEFNAVLVKYWVLGPSPAVELYKLHSSDMHSHYKNPLLRRFPTSVLTSKDPDFIDLIDALEHGGPDAGILDWSESRLRCLKVLKIKLSRVASGNGYSEALRAKATKALSDLDTFCARSPARMNSNKVEGKTFYCQGIAGIGKTELCKAVNTMVMKTIVDMAREYDHPYQHLFRPGEMPATKHVCRTTVKASFFKVTDEFGTPQLFWANDDVDVMERETEKYSEPDEFGLQDIIRAIGDGYTTQFPAASLEDKATNWCHLMYGCISSNFGCPDPPGAIQSRQITRNNTADLLSTARDPNMVGRRCVFVYALLKQKYSHISGKVDTNNPVVESGNASSAAWDELYCFNIWEPNPSAGGGQRVGPNSTRKYTHTWNTDCLVDGTQYDKGVSFICSELTFTILMAVLRDIFVEHYRRAFAGYFLREEINGLVSSAALDCHCVTMIGCRLLSACPYCCSINDLDPKTAFRAGVLQNTVSSNFGRSMLEWFDGASKWFTPLFIHPALISLMRCVSVSLQIESMVLHFARFPERKYDFRVRSKLLGSAGDWQSVVEASVSQHRDPDDEGNYHSYATWKAFYESFFQDGEVVPELSSVIKRFFYHLVVCNETENLLCVPTNTAQPIVMYPVALSQCLSRCVLFISFLEYVKDRTESQFSELLPYDVLSWQAKVDVLVDKLRSEGLARQLEPIDLVWSSKVEIIHLSGHDVTCYNLTDLARVRFNADDHIPRYTGSPNKTCDLDWFLHMHECPRTEVRVTECIGEEEKDPDAESEESFVVPPCRYTRDRLTISFTLLDAIKASFLNSVSENICTSEEYMERMHDGLTISSGGWSFVKDDPELWQLVRHQCAFALQDVTAFYQLQLFWFNLVDNIEALEWNDSPDFENDPGNDDLLLRADALRNNLAHANVADLIDFTARNMGFLIRCCDTQLWFRVIFGFRPQPPEAINADALLTIVDTQQFIVDPVGFVGPILGEKAKNFLSYGLMALGAGASAFAVVKLVERLTGPRLVLPKGHPGLDYRSEVDLVDKASGLAPSDAWWAVNDVSVSGSNTIFTSRNVTPQSASIGTAVTAMNSYMGKVSTRVRCRLSEYHVLQQGVMKQRGWFNHLNSEFGLVPRHFMGCFDFQPIVDATGSFFEVKLVNSGDIVFEGRLYVSYDMADIKSPFFTGLGTRDSVIVQMSMTSTVSFPAFNLFAHDLDSHYEASVTDHEGNVYKASNILAVKDGSVGGEECKLINYGPEIEVSGQVYPCQRYVETRNGKPHCLAHQPMQNILMARCDGGRSSIGDCGLPYFVSNSTMRFPCLGIHVGSMRFQGHNYIMIQMITTDWLKDTPYAAVMTSRNVRIPGKPKTKVDKIRQRLNVVPQVRTEMDLVTQEGWAEYDEDGQLGSDCSKYSRFIVHRSSQTRVDKMDSFFGDVTSYFNTPKSTQLQLFTGSKSGGSLFNYTQHWGESIDYLKFETDGFKKLTPGGNSRVAHRFCSRLFLLATAPFERLDFPENVLLLAPPTYRRDDIVTTEIKPDREIASMMIRAVTPSRLTTYAAEVSQTRMREKLVDILNSRYPLGSETIENLRRVALCTEEQCFTGLYCPDTGRTLVKPLDLKTSSGSTFKQKDVGTKKSDIVLVDENRHFFVWCHAEPTWEATTNTILSFMLGVCPEDCVVTLSLKDELYVTPGDIEGHGLHAIKWDERTFDEDGLTKMQQEFYGCPKAHSRFVTEVDNDEHVCYMQALEQEFGVQLKSKVRTISVLPLGVTVAMKMFFAPLMFLLNEHPHDFETAIGVDLSGPDGEISYLLIYNFAGRYKGEKAFWDADIHKYDKIMPRGISSKAFRQLVDMVIDIHYKLGHDLEGVSKMGEALYEWMLYHEYFVLKQLLPSSGTVPSGHAMTTPHNNTCGDILAILIVFQFVEQFLPDHFLEVARNLCLYFKIIKFGDDTKCAISQKFIDLCVANDVEPLNCGMWNAYMKSYGIHSTLANKDGTEAAMDATYAKPSDIVLLQRSAVYVTLPRWTWDKVQENPTLAADRVSVMANRLHPKIFLKVLGSVNTMAAASKSEVFLGSVQSYMCELVPYGREKFIKMREALLIFRDPVYWNESISTWDLDYKRLLEIVDWNERLSWYIKRQVASVSEVPCVSPEVLMMRHQAGDAIFGELRGPDLYYLQ